MKGPTPQELEWREALAAATQALQGVTRASAVHAKRVTLLAALEDRAHAIAALREALALDRGAPEDMEALGFAAFSVNEHHLARDCYSAVVELAPHDALAWYNLASAERNVGRLDAAEAACDRALALDDRLFQAELLRSQLRPQVPSRNHVDSLRAKLQAAGAAAPAEIFLNYALGKELDDLGAYPEAFQHFERGAAARRRTLDYSVARDVGNLLRIVDVYPREQVARTRGRRDDPQDGFIVGLPRSGTTLIERVLTGHPGVHSNGETDNFARALMAATPAGPGDIFLRATRAAPAQVAHAYRRLAGEAPAGGLLLEKLPLNYLYLGAITAALPAASLLLVTRDPLDNCFAMFSTLFGAGYPFSYSLADLAEYCGAYARLIEHWKSALGGSLLDISYEAFVEEPERLGPTIAGHAGLNWSPASLAIDRNPTASATASAAQVRRPIYRSAVGRWRNYADQLAPLRKALREQGIASA
jgi:tetratricopeptide (TPR) repeat protein